MPIWAWAVIAVVLFALILLFSPIVALIALGILITGIVALSNGSRTWLRLKSRRAAIGVTAGAAVLLLITGGVSAAGLAGQAGDVAEAEPARFADTGQSSAAEATSSPTPKPTKSPTPTPTPVVTTREDVVTEAIAFTQTTADAPNLPRGQSAITTAGQAGQRTLTYMVTFVDGVETGRELSSDVVTVNPITEVTSVGVYDPPPPAAPPADSGCDPNYADACVPIDSDVDCAWGSGDGPSWFDGVARVVGTDKYGLDRDGDGWACER